jgi:hypothetical protein
MAILNAPAHYLDLLGELPPDVVVAAEETSIPLDFIHLFLTKREDLERAFPQAKDQLSETGMLWVSWPKQSSNLRGDLKENIVREIGLSNGLVDVKVAAIDADWSGLKFVYRLQDRTK